MYFLASKNIFAKNNCDFIKAIEFENYKINNLEIHGRLPRVCNLKNNKFEQELNDKINLIYKNKLESAIINKALVLDLDYKIKFQDNKISIVMSFDNNKSLETINFDVKNNKLLFLKDIIGANAIEIINKFIKNITIGSPEKYDINFSGISLDQNFYLEENNLIIILNSFELSLTIKEIQEFKINIAQVNNKILESNSYFLKDPYNLKIIPLREICEAFNYEITWLSNLPGVKIKKLDSKIIIYINKNSYVKNSQPSRSLESVAELRDNKIYVPVSFFEEFLDLFYSIDENNNIIFSSYE